MSTVKISELQEKSTMEGTEEVLINDSGTSKKFSTQRFLDAKTAAETAQAAAALAQGAAETAEANAEDWATKETETVDGTNYSAKYWATSADVVAVAGKETEIGRLGTADAVADMNTLGTTDIVSDMDALADKAAELGRLGTTDAVSDMNTLGSAAIVADMNTVAGKATEIGLLGTTDAVSDMNALASTTTVSDMNTLATSTNVSNLATCAGDIAAIQGASAAASAAAGSAAAAATTYDSFDDRYLGNKSSEPSTDNDGNTLVAGALYFDTTDDNMMVWDGTDWITTSSATLTTLDIYKFTSGSAQSVFTGTDDDGNTLVIKPTAEMVTMNGIVLEPTTDYTVTTSTLTLTSNATTDDEVNIYAFGNFELADHYSKTASDARYLNLAGGTLTGDLALDNTASIISTNTTDAADNKSLTLAGGGGVASTRGASVGLYGNENTAFAGHVRIQTGNTGGADIELITMNSSNTPTTHLIVKDDTGKVGIGTTSPDETLEVSGDIKSASSAGFGIYHFGVTSDETKIVGRDNSHATSPNTMEFFTNSTERMTIDSSGLVGIGTSSPTSKLSVSGAGTQRIDISNTSLSDTGEMVSLQWDTSADFTIQGRDSTAGFKANWYRIDASSTDGLADNHIWYTGASVERMRIDSTGNVGIGTDSPSSKMHIEGGSSTQLRLSDGSDGWEFRAGTNLLFKDDGVEKMRINSSGNVGIGTSSPNSKLQIGDATVSSSNKLTFGKAEASSQTHLPVIQHASADGVSNDLVLAATSGTGRLRFFTGAGSSSGSYGTSSNVERITIDSTGKVGIGTSSPTAKLHIDDSSANAHLYLTGGGGLGQSYGGFLNGYGGAGSGGRFELGVIDNNTKKVAISVTEQSNQIKLSTAGTERMRIDSSGNVNFGTASTGNNYTRIWNTNVGQVDIGGAGTGSDNRMRFYNANGAVGSIATNGGSTAYNTSSDYRLKENVTPMTGSIDRLKELKPSRFNFIADADTTVDGFLAHEAQEVVPEAISGDKDAMTTEEYEVTPAVYETITIEAVEEELDEEGNVVVEAQAESTEEKLVTEAVMGEREVEDMQGIDQSKLVPLLVASLQEAIAKIEELTTRIETLEVN